MKLAVVIPAYNEEETIKKVLLSLPKKIKLVDEIVSIVVDDGSTDKTYTLSKEAATYSVQHVVNLGVGAATITGFEAAKKIKADIIVTIDADGQHNPNDIERLIAPILQKKADVVIGTRMLDTANMPGIKIFGNWIMNVITYLVFHKWSTDSQSGMKAFDKKALARLNFQSIGYEICSEMIGEIKRNKLKLIEVPIETIYSDYSKAKGQSILNAVNILTRILTIKITTKK